MDKKYLGVRTALPDPDKGGHLTICPFEPPSTDLDVPEGMLLNDVIQTGDAELDRLAIAAKAEGNLADYHVYTGDPDEALEMALEKLDRVVGDCEVNAFTNVLVSLSGKKPLDNDFANAPALKALFDYVESRYLVYTELAAYAAQLPKPAGPIRRWEPSMPKGEKVAKLGLNKEEGWSFWIDSRLEGQLIVCRTREENGKRMDQELKTVPAPATVDSRHFYYIDDEGDLSRMKSFL